MKRYIPPEAYRAKYIGPRADLRKSDAWVKDGAPGWVLALFDDQTLTAGQHWCGFRATFFEKIVDKQDDSRSTPEPNAPANPVHELPRRNEGTINRPTIHLVRKDEVPPGVPMDDDGDGSPNWT